MCEVLKIPRSTYYREIKQQKSIQLKEDDMGLETLIIEIFKTNRKCFGTRRIKTELAKHELTVSRRRIARVMKKNNLVSAYTVASYKPYASKSNEHSIKNNLNRDFNRQQPMEAIVSYLTYVRVAGKCHYVCLFIDLFNREIVGHSVGKQKNAELISKAISTINHDLRNIQMFHTDRGKEFDNQEIEKVLNTFGIQRSLSMKGCPYDNAVAEATFKALKTEFINQSTFMNLGQLEIELFDYINWYNNIRSHGTLSYLTPKEYKDNFIKVV